MKSKDVVIGMKVVPTQKSIGTPGFPTWRNVSTVSRAIRHEQPFLYVVGWYKEEKCWLLSDVNRSGGDWAMFTSKDFYLYTGENHEI